VFETFKSINIEFRPLTMKPSEKPHVPALIGRNACNM